MTVFAQSAFVRDLANDPQAQTRLLFLCKLALHPASMSWPALVTDPTRP